MKKVIIYSTLLVIGLIISQFLGGMGEEWIKVGTMLCLSFIMIRVGYEFEINKTNPQKYAWDYLVSLTTAIFPWIFCACYFFWALDMNSWKEAVLLTKFLSLTSIGVLFSMLKNGGFTHTWVFRKARVITIFDDLNIVLFMIPLKIIMVGMIWQLGVIMILMLILLWMAWRYLHLWRLPINWPWMMFYAVLITGFCEIFYLMNRVVEDVVPVQLEVLLPAFVFGCMLARPVESKWHHSDLHENDQEVLESPVEQHVEMIVISIFMILVGLSTPLIPPDTIDWGLVAIHVAIVTLLSNLGKMFPFFCYRKEATVRERLALAIAMFPRGEVGAGVLMVSMSYGIAGVALKVAILSLALNLLLTGLFITVIKKLIGGQV